jgi:CubicO group peptidase (beta-lactamase class C family)
VRILALIGFAMTSSVVSAATIDGTWRGAIDVPGSPLQIIVEFTVSETSVEGQISIPVQGLNGARLVNIAQMADDVEFAIEGVPGNPFFRGQISEDGESIEGTFSQNGAQILFALGRTDPAESAREKLAAMDQIGDEAVEWFNVAGAGIAVVYHGKVVYANGFGFRDVVNEVPMDADTLFAIGSTTKAMTATVLGMLVDDGKLDFDARVRDFLPSFRLSDDRVGDALTIRDLITHRSGMPRHDLLWYNQNVGTREELIGRLQHLELTAGVRETFQYNNLMFMTAGHLGARAADRDDWEALMRERLLQPLGMARTNLSVLDSVNDANHALPYRVDEEELKEIPFRRIDLIGPAGSVNSSVNEMTAWLKLNLGGGVFDDRRLVSKAVLDDVQSHHMPAARATPDPMMSPAVYGLGWMVGTYRGRKHLYHGGGIDGFTTNVMLLPEDSLGLVAFTNTASSLPQWLNLAAADLVLGHDDRDWIGEALARAEALEQRQQSQAKERDPRHRRRTKPTHPVAQYAGDYRHPGYGHLEVVLDRGSMAARINDMTATLRHWHYDVWEADDSDPTVAFAGRKFQFAVNVHGDVASVAVRLEPAAAPIVFAKDPPARMSEPDFLEALEGRYDVSGQVVSVSRRGRALILSVPQQPPRTLVPSLGGRFALKSLPDYEILFEDDAAEIVLLQPNGIFRGRRIEDAARGKRTED